MHSKKISKLATLLTMAGLAIAVCFCPMTTLPVQAAAASEEMVAPCSDIINYRFKILDNKIYKRLYNYSTGEWIGDWIYVRDVPEE